MTDFKSYIVTLKDHVSDADFNGIKDKVHQLGGSVTSELSLIKGFTAKIPSSIHSDAIGSHEHVAHVEEDKEVHIQK